MIEIVRELVDAVARLRGISGNRQAELHAQLDEFKPEPAKPAKPAKPSEGDGSAS